MVNISDLLGKGNQLQKLLIGAVEEGEVYRLKLSKEEGIVPKNAGDPKHVLRSCFQVAK